MSNFTKCDKNFSISVPEYEILNNVTYYKIHVLVEEVEWKVSHRYRDFIELHDALVSDNGIAKDLLPPKKMLGNRDPQFIEKRKISLEMYLKTVVNFLQKSLPYVLRKFLDFNRYDVLSIIQDMASYCFSEGDTYLQTSSNYIFNPLQLHAISKRLEKACPETEVYNNQYNFSHILDFCGHLSSITIRGGNQNVGKSNIMYNKLPFELSVFKNVTSLYFYNVKLDNIYNFGTLRQTVCSIVICNSSITTVGEALLSDKVHKNLDALDDTVIWNKLTKIDLSWNKIKNIDNCVKLIPNLQSLTIDGNTIESLGDINLLHNLTHLCMSANRISLNESIEEKLKKVVHLNLSQNKITSLKPFSNLLALHELDLGANWISDFVEIKHICQLPNLVYLILTGNPVSTLIDYRVKVFEYFEERSSDLCLDNEKPSQKELDTAAVLRALTIVREGKTPFS